MIPTLYPTIVPNIVPGLLVHLDSADTNTIVSSGGAVSTWKDKSGNGNNATQSTGASQPSTGSSTINGRNALGFSGSKFFSLANGVLPTGDSSYDIFLVATFSSETAGMRWINSGSNAGTKTQNNFIYNGSGVFNNGWTGSGALTPSSTLTINTPFIIDANYDGANRKIYVSNSLSSTTASSGRNNDNTSNYIGCDQTAAASFLIGSIGCILVYNRVLTDTERTGVYGYLKARFGL